MAPPPDDGTGGTGGLAAFEWRYHRAIRLVEPVVERVLATYATSFCLRPLRRADYKGDGWFRVRWSIDGEAMVDLFYDGRVPVDLVVHDIALMRPLRKQLRTRRVRIQHATAVEPAAAGVQLFSVADRARIRRLLLGAALLVLVADTAATATRVDVDSPTAAVASAADSPIPAHQPSPAPTAPTTTLLPVPVNAPDPYAPEPLVQIGTLTIPAIGLDAPLFEGITLPTINNGPSHWPGTAMPGQLGNVVIAGHRVTHTHPFRHLELLKPGDTATFTTAAGTFTYTLVSEEIVDPEAVRIVDQTMAYTATMFACHPPGSSKQRIVADWQLVDAASVPVPGAEQAVVAGN